MRWLEHRAEIEGQLYHKLNALVNHILPNVELTGAARFYRAASSD